MSEPEVYRDLAEAGRADAQVPGALEVPAEHGRNSGRRMLRGLQAAEAEHGPDPGRLHHPAVQHYPAGKPEAEVFVWSDMLDPNHNAHGNYYLVEGDYTGSWQYVPKDLTIVCWYYEKRNESLALFSGLGFQTLGRGLLRRRHAGQPAGLARRAGSRRRRRWASCIRPGRTSTSCSLLSAISSIDEGGLALDDRQHQSPSVAGG